MNITLYLLPNLLPNINLYYIKKYSPLIISVRINESTESPQKYSYSPIILNVSKDASSYVKRLTNNHLFNISIFIISYEIIKINGNVYKKINFLYDICAQFFLLL
jgi:hypothetical protein